MRSSTVLPKNSILRITMVWTSAPFQKNETRADPEHHRQRPGCARSCLTADVRQRSMISPVAKFFAQDKVTVVFESLTIHCAYWVEWSNDRWHVQVERIEESRDRELPNFDRVSSLVKEALRGAASRSILVEEAISPEG